MISSGCQFCSGGQGLFLWYRDGHLATSYQLEGEESKKEYKYHIISYCVMWIKDKHNIKLVAYIQFITHTVELQLLEH